MSSSFFSTPVLLPLSLTAMTVVTSTGKSFRPDSRQESPVPPPKTTIFFTGAQASFFLSSRDKSTIFSQSSA